MNGEIEAVSVGESVNEEGAPVPASVPGDFVIRLGTDVVWDEAMVALMLSWLEWVEEEVQGVDNRLDEG
jgi:hypothetical protein